MRRHEDIARVTPCSCGFSPEGANASFHRAGEFPCAAGWCMMGREVIEVAKTPKTNAVREAERLRISVRVIEYEADESDLSAAHAAASCGVPLERIYKTLVLRGDGRAKELLAAVIPGAMELDLKKLAALSGYDKVEMIHMKELFGLTGYVRGGCSPLGMKKKLPTFLDESALRHECIAVSAGRRGLQMELDPRDLQRAAGATIGAISREAAKEEEKTW
ncbi:Cys-tRNA(Pro) deacylase [Pyramidobacter sp. CG50-2]|uniref:Cys-tRNA(Pro) deacylase n=1 Tax=Pyramidobacter sp. CG50-2 TaxID=2382160 RepID=UPI000EA0AE29|nr:Cys-tRNA(Pro) deacylase [Pyramidobacter sp. CG50-2]